MLGCYDFNGHYDWTFDWLERVGGHELVRAYWDEGISRDSQKHARDLIGREGFAGMAKYWGHALVEESPDLGFDITQGPDFFRIDMHDCPSKGFLLRNGIESYSDYCDHCMGWVGPLMRDAGFVIDHEHNHRGQCWWEMRAAGTPGGYSAPGAMSGQKDVRLREGWSTGQTPMHHYVKATDPDAKTPGA